MWTQISQGSPWKGREFKVAAFADDMLILTQPHISLLAIIKQLDAFQVISNLKINYSKCSILNISLPEEKRSISVEPAIPSNGRNRPLPTWEPRYSLSDLYPLKINHCWLIWNRTSCHGASPIYPGLAGLRWSKMSNLPKFYYVMQIILIHLPQLSSLVWNTI